MLCYKGRHCQWVPGKTDWTLSHRNISISAGGENYTFYIIFRLQILKATHSILQTWCGYWFQFQHALVTYSQLHSRVGNVNLKISWTCYDNLCKEGWLLWEKPKQPQGGVRVTDFPRDQLLTHCTPCRDQGIAICCDQVKLQELPKWSKICHITVGSTHLDGIPCKTAEFSLPYLDPRPKRLFSSLARTLTGVTTSKNIPTSDVPNNEPQ